MSTATFDDIPAAGHETLCVHASAASRCLQGDGLARLAAAWPEDAERYGLDARRRAQAREQSDADALGLGHREFALTLL